MNGATHVTIGAGSAALVAFAIQHAGGSTDSKVVIPVILAAAAGSLAPDLDHQASLASARIPGTLVASSAVFLGFRAYEMAHRDTGMFDFGSMLKPLLNNPKWVSTAWVALAAGISLFLLSLFCSFFGHRGIVHSVGAGLMASVLVAIGLAIFHAPISLALVFAWGWAAHLVADATTPAGLEYAFWPFAR